MKSILISAMALSVALGSVASAQPYGHDRDHGRDGRGDAHDQHRWGQDYGGNHHWRRGERIGYNDWQSAHVVDYHQHHLRRPPRGYEWRETNGNYVLAAVATGVIASIILNSGH
jgi:Ni/Co efflux regulator RcnB